MIKTKPLLINLLLSAVALFLHGYLSQKFFDLQNGAASGQSLCNLSSVWNCDVVSTSKYARMFGHPIALWAFVVHLIFIVSQVMVLMRQDVKDYWSQVTVWIATVIAGASLIMGFISITQLHTFCLFCITAYGLSFVSIVLLKLVGLDFKGSFQNFKSLITNKVSWILIAAVPFGTFILGSAWGGPMASERARSQMEDQVAAWAASPDYNFDLSTGLHLGAAPENAVMTIVEFADFRCPHCKFAAPTLKAFVQSRPNVALVFKPYPLDGACNMAPVFQGSGDGISCRLAFAVQCSENLYQKGWDMYSHIFDNQEEYRQMRSVSDVENKLCSSGLVADCESYKACLASDDTRIQVQKMAEEGTQAGIRGTPAFFVNKKSLNGGQFLPILEMVEKRIRNRSN